MKIILIGPDPFYKGGIAQYNHFLANEIIRQGHELLFIGFKKQYPAALYPSKTGDKTNDIVGETLYKVKRLLTGTNLFSGVSAGLAAKKFAPDLVIIPWWTWIWFFHFSVLLALCGQCRKALIAHNVKPHEKSFINRLLSRIMFRKAGHIFVQSKEEKGFLENDGFNNCSVLYHPVYPQFQPDIDRAEARKKLGLSPDDSIAFFFGIVRHYKGADIFAAACSQLPDIKCVIAGEIWDEKIKTELLDIAAKHKNIILISRYLSVEETKLWFSACDAVVLPYRSVTGSGAAMAAISARKPVVASDLPLFRDIFTDGIGIFFKNGDAADLRKKLATTVAAGLNCDPYEFIKLEKKYSWHEAVEEIILRNSERR